MSWTTNKASITSIMTTNSYIEIPDNENAEEVSVYTTHKGYSLKPKDVDTTFLTNNSTLSSHIAELKICYLCKDNTDFDTQFDAWITILNAIKNYHYGYLENPTFERYTGDAYHAIGTALIYVGTEGC